MEGAGLGLLTKVGESKQPGIVLPAPGFWNREKLLNTSGVSPVHASNPARSTDDPCAYGPDVIGEVGFTS